MILYIRIYIYIYGNVSTNLCPRPYPWKKAQTNQVLKIFARKKAPAAAIKKNRNVNNMICHDCPQKSLGKRCQQAL